MSRGIPRDLAYFRARTVMDENGCWVWQLFTAKPGHGRGGPYGKTSRMGEQRPVGAHVLSYEVFKGPVPAGHEIDHTCENTLCCNPAHLEAVTPAENKRRTHSRGNGRNQNTDKTHCPVHHTPYDMESKRGDGRTFRTCRACYRAYQREYQRGVRARRKAVTTDA